MRHVRERLYFMRNKFATCALAVHLRVLLCFEGMNSECRLKSVALLATSKHSVA